MEKFEMTVTMSKVELLLMIYNFSLRHHLSDVAMLDLVKMLNIIVGKHLPETMYGIHNILGLDCMMSINYHYYCINCFAYISSQSNSEKKMLNVIYVIKM